MKLLRFFRGSIALLCLILNLLTFGFGVFLFGLFAKLLSPLWPRNPIYRLSDLSAMLYCVTTGCILRHISGVHIHAEGLSEITPDKRYLFIANHQSWLDLMLLQSIAWRHFRCPRFFIKKQLIYFPIVGWSCWALDYPFMNRLKKSDLKKRPQLKTKDIEAVKKACAIFRWRPTTTGGFIESTRFTREKHAGQKSPYRHLLKPKAAAIAMVLNEMSDQIDAIVDMTYIYLGKHLHTWRMLTGDLSKVIIHIRLRPLASELFGSYEKDSAYRKQLQSILNGYWQEKEALMESIYAEHPNDRPNAFSEIP